MSKITLEQILLGGFFWDFGQVPEDAHRQIRALVRAGEWHKEFLPWYGTEWHMNLYYRKDITAQQIGLQ